jgi:type IV pilus assembly protein PilE
MMQAKQRGLTLIELMVVVAVMAILASVAYPLYTNQTQKSRRADAKIALESIAMAQERFYTINGRYAATLSSLQVSADIQGGASDQGYYMIANPTISGAGEQFLVTATADSSGSQSGDSSCASFTINQLGTKAAKTAGGADSPKCW